MAILNFSDVLKNVGLDPKRVKLIRHSLGDKAFKKCYGMAPGQFRTEKCNK